MHKFISRYCNINNDWGLIHVQHWGVVLSVSAIPLSKLAFLTEIRAAAQTGGKYMLPSYGRLAGSAYCSILTKALLPPDPFSVPLCFAQTAPLNVYS